MLPDGKILIVGGMGADGQPVDMAEILDPETQTPSFLRRLFNLQPSILDPRSLLGLSHPTLLTEDSC